MSILAYNGCAVIAMTGKDCVAIASDLRFGVQQTTQATDFKKVFNYLYETVRGLLIYAKEGKFDRMFMEEGLIPQLCYVISKCFIEHGSPLLTDLLSQTVANKTIRNDDKVLDLLNYTIGTIKCFTHSNKDVQMESVNNKMVTLLSLTISKILEFDCSS